jgi:SulP family sulfate permease
MLIAMGLVGAGKLIVGIPRPVVTGFTAGLAVYIFSTQLRDAVGLRDAVPSEFVGKVMFLTAHIADIHLPSLALATGTILLIRVYPASWAVCMPPQIVAISAGCGIMAALHATGIQTGIQTIGSRYGQLPSALPPVSLHLPSLELATQLVVPAATIALLAAIESLLCAVVADGMMADGEKHNPSTELIAQGLANIASASVGGLPATGALARTAANVRSGGRSPVAGCVAALTVLGLMHFCGPLATDIPLPSLAAVLLQVAIGMGEWKNFQQLSGAPKGEAAVFIASCLLTILCDVTVAVEAGIALSVILYVQRIDEVSSTSSRINDEPKAVIARATLEGALCFVGTGRLASFVDQVIKCPLTRVLLIDCAQLVAVDETGLYELENANLDLKRQQKALVLSSMHGQPLCALATSGMLAKIGFNNVCPDVASAEQRAAEIVASSSITRPQDLSC